MKAIFKKYTISKQDNFRIWWKNTNTEVFTVVSQGLQQLSVSLVTFSKVPVSRVRLFYSINIRIHGQGCGIQQREMSTTKALTLAIDGHRRQSPVRNNNPSSSPPQLPPSTSSQGNRVSGNIKLYAITSLASNDIPPIRHPRPFSAHTQTVSLVVLSLP